MLTVVGDPAGDGARDVAGASASVLDELVREGARRMLAAALEAEVAAHVDAHIGGVDQHGRRLVVRNGHAEPRQVMTAAGAVQVVAPRVNDRRADEFTGERRRFSSAILPPWCRRSPMIAEVLPLLYLHGLSSQDFAPALEQFLGSSAGLSASVITKLTVQWQDEAKAFGARDLSAVDHVYVWADGIDVNVRLEEERLRLLVLVGVRADGTKELNTLADGYRESAGSWATCCAMLPAAGCAPPCWPSGTARWGSGPRRERCSRRPGPSGAGSTGPVINQLVGASVAGTFDAGFGARSSAAVR
jgi:putative transposase